MKRWLWFTLCCWLGAAGVAADETGLLRHHSPGPLAPEFVIDPAGELHLVRVCYNWSCNDNGLMGLVEADMRYFDRLFRNPACTAWRSPALELQMIRLAIRFLEERAGEQLPVGDDLGGNTQDRETDGRTDCVDNATNTTGYLRFLQELGYLDYWHTPPEGRTASSCSICGVPRHYAAVITLAGREKIRYVVDSWLVKNGSLPNVGPLDSWRYRFLFEDKRRLNPYISERDIERLCDARETPREQFTGALGRLPGVGPDSEPTP